MTYDEELAELLITKLPLRRHQRAKREVEEACASLIGGLATMLDVGPRKGSQWSDVMFNQKVKDLLDDFTELFNETFHYEEDETGS